MLVLVLVSLALLVESMEVVAFPDQVWLTWEQFSPTLINSW